MIYRETGDFKTSYQKDQQLFPIEQDRIVVILFCAFAVLVVPFIINDYWEKSVLIPVLVWSLAALGLNILTGYCGQVSLGTGGFMAVGAYASYKLTTMFPEWNIILVILLSGGITAFVGIVFGLPSLRIKGFYLAVATLASQFFLVWLFNKVPWFYNYSASGQITAPERTLFGVAITGPNAPPWATYLFCLLFVMILALVARNLTRGRMGRSWMAIRDLDIAAEIIGIKPLVTKLSAFAVSSFYVGVSGAIFFLVYLGAVERTEAGEQRTQPGRPVNHPGLDVGAWHGPAADLRIGLEQRTDRGAGARPLVVGCDDDDLVVAVETRHRLDQDMESAGVDSVVVGDHQAHWTILARRGEPDLNGGL